MNEMTEFESVYNARVLVVDDEPANIFLLEGILTEEDFEVITASTGGEALEAIENSNPDVVLLDLMMPGMDGFQVLDAIRDNKKMKDIPVIVVSAKTDVEDVKIALDKGAVDYIRKPVNEVDLLARLRTSVRIKKREDDLKRHIKLKERFISIVSHDLRSPLTSIMLYADVLTKRREFANNLTPQQKDFIQSMFQEASRMNDYLDKLLNMAFLESGKFKLKIEENYLSELVEESVKTYASGLKEKYIETEIEIPEDLKVNVDKTLFIQVINNLLNNAIKFTPPQGSIQINASVQDGRTLLKIKDTGIGIIPEEQGNIFNEFHTAYSRGTEGEKGTGLGLSICRKILDAHGFDISFASKTGVGTEFVITMKN